MSAHDRFAKPPLRSPGRTRPVVLPVVMGLLVALSFVVPDSEFRAKVFRAQLIIKNVGRLALAKA